MTALTMQDTLNELTPLLCKFAAHHTGTRYTPTVDGLAMEAQDLYQHAVASILRECKEGDTKSYMLTKADWRMSNKSTSDRSTYYERISTESELEGDGKNDDDDGDTILDIIAVDRSNPETVLIEREAADAIQDAVSRMKPEWTVVVKLLKDGYQLPEIAVKLGISYDAVWKRVNHIRQMFQSAGLSPAALLA